MQIGNKIYELRKEHGLSQERLAEKVDVARQTISKWELGETAPDIKQAQILAEIFNVSLDELICDDARESVHGANDRKKQKSIPWRMIVIVSAAILFLCLVTGVVIGGIKRSQILHPYGAEGNVVITRKGSIQIGKDSGGTIVFNEKNKPTITCELPAGFVADSEINGLYSEENGNFIRFNSDFSDNVYNPLSGTDYFPYYESRGYRSYIDIADFAMYNDYPKLGIFAPKEELYLAGGAQLIRQQLCAGQNADYYKIDGGLTSNGKETRISGFALHFDNIVWQIILKDCDDNYYFVTIKDPDGIGKAIDTVGELLSTIVIEE